MNNERSLALREKVKKIFPAFAVISHGKIHNINALEDRLQIVSGALDGKIFEVHPVEGVSECAEAHAMACQQGHDAPLIILGSQFVAIPMIVAGIPMLIPTVVCDPGEMIAAGAAKGMERVGGICRVMFQGQEFAMMQESQAEEMGLA